MRGALESVFTKFRRDIAGIELKVMQNPYDGKWLSASNGTSYKAGAECGMYLVEDHELKWFRQEQ